VCSVISDVVKRGTSGMVERSPFREAEICSADQEFPVLYGIQEFLTYLEEPAKSESPCNIL
jgi:hypothetical protein